MEWLIIDEEYLNYLRDKEKRIPHSDYGKNKYKPFFGILFETNNFYYVTQVSHPKQKHLTMKANIDFKKIYDIKSDRLIAVINLNYMFPIPKSMYKKLQYKDLDIHRNFKDEIEKSKYIALMKTELKVINTMNLDKAAFNLYHYKYEKPDSSLAKRCFDFKNLEISALQYTENA